MVNGLEYAEKCMLEFDVFFFFGQGKQFSMNSPLTLGSIHPPKLAIHV